MEIATKVVWMTVSGPSYCLITVPKDVHFTGMLSWMMTRGGPMRMRMMMGFPGLFDISFEIYQPASDCTC